MSRVTRLRGAAGQEVVLVAGITGLASDAEVLRAELAALPLSKVLLGVPYEDLDAIRATSGKEHETPFESASLDDEYVTRLKKYGAVTTPPPDLYVAYQHASQVGVPVEAIDLGDEAYTDAYTKNVGFFEVLRNNRQQRKITQIEFDALSADSFVKEWDAALNATKGLRRVQQAREEAMAKAVEDHARAGATLALVPLPRAEGVLERLRRAGWTAR